MDKSKNISSDPSKFKLDVDWFEKGGRHGIDNRTSDISWLFNADLEQYCALEIGCAEGAMLPILDNVFGLVKAIEVSKTLSEKAIILSKSLKNTSVEQGDFINSQFRDSFDFIFAMGVLHYFDEKTKQEFIRKIASYKPKFVFIRTCFSENKQSKPNTDKIIHKCTELKLIANLARDLNYRWLFLDNLYREETKKRLGDLLVLQFEYDENTSLIGDLMQLVFANKKL